MNIYPATNKFHWAIQFPAPIKRFLGKGGMAATKPDRRSARFGSYYSLTGGRFKPWDIPCEILVEVGNWQISVRLQIIEYVWTCNQLPRHFIFCPFTWEFFLVHVFLMSLGDFCFASLINASLQLPRKISGARARAQFVTSGSLPKLERWWHFPSNQHLPMGNHRKSPIFPGLSWWFTPSKRGWVEAGELLVSWSWQSTVSSRWCPNCKLFQTLYIYVYIYTVYTSLRIYQF